MRVQIKSIDAGERERKNVFAVIISADTASLFLPAIRTARKARM
jgi:hypothetical protein